MINLFGKPAEIVFIAPGYEYGDGGNTTHVHLRHCSKPLVIHRPMKWVLKRLARAGDALTAVDKATLIRWLDHRQMLPIALSPDLVFMPVHCRTAPHNLHDGCTAYINLAVLESEVIFPEHHTQRDKVYFELDSGLVIHTATNWETFNRHRNEARRVRDKLTERNLKNLLRFLRQFLM